MNKEYCISCGERNTFEAARPKFCSGCGTPFNKSTSKASHQKEVDDEYEESEDSFGHVDINKLKEAIAVDMDFSKTTTDDLFANPIAPEEKEKFSRKYNGPEGKALLEDIAKKAGTSITKNDD